MANTVDITDNSAAIKEQMRRNVNRALVAMGQAGLELIIDTMNTGYERKIYLTGDLQRSMSFNVNGQSETVTWGTNLDYGIPVHEGTSKKAGRPFLTDGIMNHKDELREVAAAEIREGF